jgi:transposase
MPRPRRCRRMMAQFLPAGPAGAVLGSLPICRASRSSTTSMTMRRFAASMAATSSLWGEAVSEQFEFIPTQVRVIKNIRRKYTCPACEGNVVTAKAPAQLIPKSMATPSLLAWIAVSKYADALPLYRQCTIFERIGFEADRTTLANWMMACGERVQPLINLLSDRLREAPFLHLDETTVQVLKEPGRAAQSKSWMWVSAAG